MPSRRPLDGAARRDGARRLAGPHMVTPGARRPPPRADALVRGLVRPLSPPTRVDEEA